MIARRTFLAALTALLSSGSRPAGAAARTSLALAYTSFAVRLARGRDLLKASGVALPADTFAALCASFGSAGAQVDFSQLGGEQPERLAAVREAFAQAGVAVEVSMPARLLETPDRYAQAVAVARALGARRARVALLSGRRYESFATAEAWLGFRTRWRDTLVRMRPEFNRHAFPIGLENHKDWLAPELVDLLDTIGSPHVGVCLDFGNNLALLEDPDETIALLAPRAVTTHVKDMAVRTTPEGFELSEVPLGTGMLPLVRYLETVRRVRPDVPLCLEMITRDPLHVPYRTDRFWVAFGERLRAPSRLQAFETRVLAQTSATPLPRVGHLPLDARLQAEDDNIRACVRWARETARLEMPTA